MNKSLFRNGVALAVCGLLALASVMAPDAFATPSAAYDLAAMSIGQDLSGAWQLAGLGFAAIGMTSPLTMGARPWEFVLHEAVGSRARENGTVAQGQTLVAGQVVMLSAGKLVAQDGALDTGGELVTASVGIIGDNVDASSDGTNADTPAAYIARDAEVKDELITYPPETTDTGEKVATVASLAALGIIVRD